MTHLYLLLAIALASGAAKTVLCKKIGMTTNGPADLLFYNSLTFAVIFLITFVAWLINITGISWFTVLLALAFAAVNLIAQTCNMQALKEGPMGVCVFLYSCGFVIAAFSGVLFWGEAFVWTQAAGVALLVASFLLLLLLSEFKRKTLRMPHKRWIFFALLSMIASGGLGVIQKAHQSSAHRNELFAFLFISFAAAGAFAFALHLFLGPRSARRCPASGSKLALLNGLAFGAVNILNLFLAGQLPSMVFFSVYNGGLIVVGAFVGVIFFQEKLKKYDIAGLTVGIAGILLIAMKPD